MKINSPVTNVEKTFTADESLYSRTDLKGRIEEVNDNFVRMSGFTREELIGKAHNIVRHPDVPPAAFADLWVDLKAGRPWRGVLKNWRKDGGFYWVVANVSPVRKANGDIVGYQSVRFSPSREEIQAAEAAFARIRAGDKKLSVHHGKVTRHQPLRNLLGSEAFSLGLLAIIACAPSLASLAGHGQNWLNALSILYVIGFLVYFGLRNQLLRNDLGNWLLRLLETGDLRQPLPSSVNKNPQIAALGNRMYDFVCAMRATVKGVEDIAQRVVSVANHTQTSVNDVYQASQAQTEATSSSAAALEQVTVSIGEVSSQAKTTQDTALKAGADARAAQQISSEAGQKIAAVADFIQTTSRQINALGERSEEIGRVVSLIREIADQTNLLALNAAIEAARAGEQGRGFAVVADEVRKLAERTSLATEEIGRMISGIHHEAAQAVTTMEQGEAQINAGVDVVDAVRAALQQIDTSLATAIDEVKGITQSTEDQRAVMEEMVHHVERVNSMTHANVDSATQTKALTDQLQAIGGRMLESAQQYRV